MLDFHDLSRLFPFYLNFSNDGLITHEGDDWNYYGISRLGQNLEEAFTFKQPKIKKISLSALNSLESSIFLIVDNTTRLEFRFQLVCHEDSFLLCGGLSLNSNQLWDENNIKYHRFAPHDVTGDYLIFKKTLELLQQELKSSGNLVQKYQNEAFERKRSEHILNSLINALPDPVVITDKDGKIFRSNFHFEHFFSPIDNINDIKSHSEKYYYNDESVLHTIVVKDEKSTHLKLSKSKDQVSGLQLWASSDITNLINQQDELQLAYEKASESEKSKSRFFANMSHELRTPFNGILGISELLLESSSDPQYVEQLQIIYNSCHSLLRIVNDILDLSKLESGKLKYETISFEFRMFVESVMELMKSYPHSDKTELILDVDPALPRYLKGDEHRLRQVLFNLLSNGLKFTQEGRVSLLVKKAKKNIQYEIKDTGIGISPEQLEVVFETFSQGSVEVSRLYGGTGLGLNISQKLIHGMDGHLHVTSELGKGTQFVIELPLVEGEAPAQLSGNRGIDPRWNGLNALIVDDNPTNLKVLSLILKRLGVNCVEFLSGNDLIDYLQNNSFDVSLLVLDIQMPQLNGQEVFQIIRKNQLVHSSIPIVALTANAFEDDIQQYIDTGFTQVLCKPISKQAIINCLNSLLK